MAPVVIYIDDVEHLFVSSKKSDSAGRFKKDLITYKKWLDERKDRVVIIGNLSDPSKLNDTSRKEIKAFFDRALYVVFSNVGENLNQLTFFMSQLHHSNHKSIAH